ncbi:MAG TPA: DUF349 domain-containing protein [Thermoanaerobaculia bacterium]|jgi:hypothetical protein|nr:DUF349 domain-containing protein [Thermoanaerobaculia bacterium]
MTDLHKREADIQDNEGTLLEDAPDSATAPMSPDSPSAAAEPADAEPPAAEPEEPLPEALAAEEPGSSGEAQAAAEAHAEAAPIPAQQLAGRVDALERQVEAAKDRARLLSRVQALRKRVDEAVFEPPAAEPAGETATEPAGEATTEPAAPADEKAGLLARLAHLESEIQAHLDENLRRKEALVLKAEELSPSTEWKETSDAIKALQAEWKTIGPVPQDRSQDLWQRFRKAGNTFFERLQEHRKEASQGTEENLHLKEALCVRAEELSNSTDWKGAAEAIKGLQAEWKAVGPAPREQADAVWKRFRKAADVFFERRKEHSDKLRKEQEENLRRKEALVARAEEHSKSTQWKATVQAIKELQAEWRTVGPAPSNKAESVWRRFRAAIDLFFERQAAYFAQRNQDSDKRQDQMLDALERKREQANRVRESIDRDEDNLKRWRATLADLQPGDRGDELRASHDAKISDVEAKLPAKRQRLDELEEAIKEIAAKL